MARSAYSRSPECGMGIAMRTAMKSAHPLDGRQSLSLATVTNFHDDCQHKNDCTSHQGHRQGKLAIANGHIRMQASHSRYDDSADNSQQQTHTKTEQSPDESHEQDAKRDAVPAGSRRTGRPSHTSNLYHPERRRRGTETRHKAWLAPSVAPSEDGVDTSLLGDHWCIKGKACRRQHQQLHAVRRRWSGRRRSPRRRTEFV